MKEQHPSADLTPEEAVLRRLSEALSSASDYREVLDLITYHAAKLLGASKTSISLNENGRLRTCARYIEPGGYFEFVRQKRLGARSLPEESHPLMYQTLRSGRPHIGLRHTIHDLKEKAEGAPPEGRQHIFHILEPLRVGDEVVGVAAINLSRENLEHMRPSQRRILQWLLTFARVALRGAWTKPQEARGEKAVLDSLSQAGGGDAERPSGVSLLGAVPGGAHIVALYESVPQLLELLSSYGAEGLRGNELCIWLLGRISRDEALAALGKRVPELDRFIDLGQLVLADWREWHLEGGRLSGSVALKAIREQAHRAAETGRQGMRIIADHSFLEPGDFSAFMDYEAAVHHELGRLKIIALCCYGLRRWSASDLVDVIRVHEYVLTEKEGSWRLSESAEGVHSNQRLRESFNLKKAVLRSLDEAVLSLDLEGRIIYANPAASRTFGYSAQELGRMNLCDLYAQPSECRLLIERLESADAPPRESEVEFRTRSGQAVLGRHKLGRLRDHRGAVIGAVVAIHDVSTIRRLEGQAAYLAEKVDELSGHGLVGVSQAMREVMRQVEMVARTDSTVLVLGETGTGKELVARAIHELSSRKRRPMVKVHCAALSPGLIESEFFGHEKGAFTGATSRRTGRFELADGGTIFLDEVGDIPLETQVKLLRVLQEREFERVGGTHTIRVDVRVVAATNRDMQPAVEAGTFRRDLYYRLNVFPIRIPPLRERPEAIPVMAAHFARSYAKALGKAIEGISPEGIRRLQTYHWPGNVRELRNVIERAVITCMGPIITVGELGHGPAPLPAEATAGAPLLELAETERRHILRVLEKTSWRVAGKGGAAELLKINPSTLRSRMKKLGISKPPSGA